MKTTVLMILTALFLMSAQTAYAEVLEAQTLGAAGGTASSSSYTVSYTVGQTSVIGKSENSSHKLNAGFWYCWNSLYGDVNDDCIVDVADLIFVRNNLNTAINDDNWRADTNGDERIDVIDLVLVRNRLGSNCSD
jgi:hypothetical protein